MGRRTRPAATTLVVPLLLLAGCGGADAVPTTDLEEQVTAQLTEAAGVAPDGVRCPDPLPAQEGASVRCALVEDAAQYGITVTTTGVTDGVVDYDIVVDEEPAEGATPSVGPVAPEALEDQVGITLAETVGQLPDDVTCPDPLPAEVGAEVRCRLLDGETELGLTVTASAVRGNTVEIDVRVDGR